MGLSKFVETLNEKNKDDLKDIKELEEILEKMHNHKTERMMIISNY